MAEGRSQIARFAAIFAGGTLLSRVLGLVRDIVLAATVPAAARDAFFFAFRLPNMLRDMLGEGATNAAFVPVFTAARETETPEAYRRMVSACLSAMLILLTVVTAAGVLLMPLVPAALAALQPFTGSAPPPAEEMAEIVLMLQWTFPYLLLIGLAVFATGPLYVARHYSTPSWSPVLLNIALIAVCFLLPGQVMEPKWALIAGVWLGGVAQLVVLFVAMRRVTGIWLPNFQLRDPAIRKVSRLLGPVLVGQAAGEVNKLVDSFFAIMLGPGVVSALFFANRLIQLPLSIFGIAISVAILPEISRAGARGEYDAVRRTLAQGLSQTTFLVAPAMVVLLMLGEPIIRLLFQRGAFDAAQTEMAAVALWYYGAGLLSFSWVKVTVQGFYALHDTKTPVKIATVSMLSNIAMNAALVGPMGFRGLALATTLSYTMNFLALYVLMGRRCGSLWDRAFAGAMLRLSVALGFLALTIFALSLGVGKVVSGNTIMTDLLHVFVPVGGGGIVYLGACALLRVSEMQDLMTLFRRRRARGRQA
jgi:putative peptidoglycan lipid II flippase